MTKAKNRTARPISSRDTMHMILKSSVAKGRFSLRHSKNLVVVRRLVERQCQKYGVKLIKYSNNSNHLHLHLKFASRALYLKFVRSLTAAIAMAVTGASKLKSVKSILGAKRFWDYRPFTRVVRSLRAYRTLQDYISLNQLEAAGAIPKREGRLKDLTDFERSLLHRPQPSRPTMSDISRQLTLL